MSVHCPHGMSTYSIYNYFHYGQYSYVRGYKIAPNKFKEEKKRWHVNKQTEKKKTVETIRGNQIHINSDLWFASQFPEPNTLFFCLSLDVSFVRSFLQTFLCIFNRISVVKFAHNKKWWHEEMLVWKLSVLYEQKLLREWDMTTIETMRNSLNLCMAKWSMENVWYVNKEVVNEAQPNGRSEAIKSEAQTCISWRTKIIVNRRHMVNSMRMNIFKQFSPKKKQLTWEVKRKERLFGSIHLGSFCNA